MNGPTRPQLPGNPIANALTVGLGVLVLVAAFAFSFVLLIAFLVALAAFAAVISVRLWWARRKFEKSGASFQSRSGAGVRPESEKSGTVVEGDFEVLAEKKDEHGR